MATRALLFTSDIRCLATGLVALASGALAFLLLAALALVAPAVSGTWLMLPCLVMVVGLAAAGAWLVFGEGARRFDPVPVTAEQWPWSPTER
ncbi:hypothetical protein [Quadrisphaera sp. INWT6]|uniref:hypothetical protein n=1 Tax=Quadrisphaera sp. INWT6 TaxID=2596917 RepID=UPI00189233AA|nr:hypothetical protein [Quadrisphaera sp. INWT6]MBF5081966.1 hypothetical protein [Quadrisphaera sp. INWT6]